MISIMQVERQKFLMAASFEKYVHGVSASLCKQALHQRDFRQRLMEGDTRDAELITSNAHSGLREPHKAVFNVVHWRSLQYNLQQDASRHAPRMSMKQEAGGRHLIPPRSPFVTDI
jgi:hypothetical protein